MGFLSDPSRSGRRIKSPGYFSHSTNDIEIRGIYLKKELLRKFMFFEKINFEIDASIESSECSPSGSVQLLAV